MQAFFPRIDLAAYRQQQCRIAEQLKEHPLLRVTPPPKRAVGRPKLKRSADEMLAAAAAADALHLQVPESKRGRYMRWFNHPLLINDIMQAHAKNGGSARATVAFLKQHASDDRFERLSHSTVASWFDKEGKLLQKHQIELDAGRALATGCGPPPALHAVPDAEEAICDILLQLRTAGTPLNSHIIRWVMQAVLQDRCPALLQQLKLSQAWISGWVRNHPRLQFRWRSRTTTASKLPEARNFEIGSSVSIHRFISSMCHQTAQVNCS